ncbi:MAG: pyrophosphohydrolase domain-containing protein [Ferrimicrobium sp.]
MDTSNHASYFADVVAWHIALDVPVGTSSDFELAPERLALRRRLIEEEVTELLDALDGEPTEAVAKEAADVVAVVLKTLAEMGIPFDAVWRVVHESNMAKRAPNGEVTRRADGKVLKPGWQSPDVAAVLRGTQGEASVSDKAAIIKVLLQQASRLTGDELDRLGEAWVGATSAEREAARNAALDAAQATRRSAWDMAYDFFVDMAESADWDDSRNAALDAVLDASLAITVRDLITPEQFDLLYESWASVVEASRR